MNIIQIVLFCVLSGIICYVIKINYPEMFSVVVLGVGIITLIMIIKYVTEVFDFFWKFYDATGISNDDITLLMKIVAITYVVEFGCNIVEDLGIKSLSDKIVIAGKIILFVISIPVFERVLNVVTTLLK